MEPLQLGDYRAIARLGRGGMADVFLCVRRGIAGFSRLVVIKRLREDLAAQPDAARFRTLLLDEARIAARLRHPNIVQTSEVCADAELPYLVLEYLDGQPVSAVMRQVRRAQEAMPHPLALAVVGDVLGALGYAHELTDYDGTPLRIVHRDVSPQNIFWTYAGEPTLVDFGVAKYAYGEETELGVVKGKVGYMAPEQARGQPIDARADVFAMGVVLWELIAGRRLLRGSSQAETLHKLLYEPLPVLPEVVPDVAPAIAAICDRALAREPADRYPSAAAMRADVERAVGGARPTRDELAAFIAPRFEAERRDRAEQLRIAMASEHTMVSLIPRAPEPPTRVLHGGGGDRASSPSSASMAELNTNELETLIEAAHAESPVLTLAQQAEPSSRSRLVTGLAVALAATLIALAVVGYQRLTREPTAAGRRAGGPAAPTAAGTPVVASTPPNLRLCGSNTVGAALAPALVARYLETKRGATAVSRVPGAVPEEQRVVATVGGEPFVVEVSAHGTGTAFEGLAAGTCDLGMASRAMNAKEAGGALGDLRMPATEHVIALDGIAVIVHPNNPIRAIDRGQLRDVFTGAITDWSALGGPAGPIALYARDDHSGTFDTFKGIILGSTPLAADARRYADSNELADTVAADPSAIGFIGLPYIRSAKALAVGEPGGAAMLPTSFTVTTEGYLLARRLYFYHRAGALAPYVADLVTFVLSSDGQAAIRDAGFVDLEVAIGAEASCDRGCPARYAKLVARARRLSLDFRFRSGADALDSRATRDLDRLTHFLADHLDAEILLLGFSDADGDARANLQLSRHRARTVADELATRGVRAAAVEGFGAALPVAANASAADRERNRRVEVWLRPRR
jgi:phosphate transport system substrate-binding protein